MKIRYHETLLNWTRQFAKLKNRKLNKNELSTVKYQLSISNQLIMNSLNL